MKRAGYTHLRELPDPGRKPRMHSIFGAIAHEEMEVGLSDYALL